MSLLTALVLTSLVTSTVGSTCKYIKSNHDDGCYNLAQRCSITQDKLTEYNSATDFCKNVEVGDYVCCSEGSLPDFSPQKGSNGSCHSYTIKKDETCSSIQTDNKMKTDTIEKYNGDTWGWAGCKNMQVGQNICLSDGTPPFPSELDGAICGPQVKGTVKPTDMPYSNWTNLNPCPLNACCDIWGICGVTADFCTNSTSDTRAPGTAKKGTNGCISNCGMDIINTDEKPDEVMRVAYFETFNLDRKCMQMDISKLEGSEYYTHVHWAFANITEDFEVDVSGSQDQFDGLKKIDDLKRSVSFGGWGFSTTEYTYSILRNGVKEANRQTLADNVVNFLKKHELDGLDFDWEYPGAQDIPGVPADSEDSGKNYLEFLKLVKAQLPSSKYLSIAAPASYWYLKNFPIKEISEVVDYIVYMTYDLHGQWDYDSPYGDDGCPEGGCLRSQVNQTEIHSSLAMITKAGVPSKKVVAGLPLYGRSFKMEDPSCTSPNCHFTGPESGATKGECTNTAGYISNYELFEIISKSENPDLYSNFTIQQYEDEGDVLIYDGNWVSWLKPETYAKRRDWTDGMNFAGTSDWAIDLNQTYADNGDGDKFESSLDEADDFEVCDWSKAFDFKNLDELSSASGDMRSDCVAVYTLQTLITMLNTAYDNYTNVNNGYDDLFSYYVTYMEDLVPHILHTELMMVGEGETDQRAFPRFGDGASYFNCEYSDVSTKCKDLAEVESGYGPPVRKDIDWKLIDEDGWDKALAKQGISPDYVEFGTYHRHQHKDNIGGRGGVQDWTYYFTDFPVKNETMVVPNPKDIILKALPSIPDLRADMQATVYDMMLGQWVGGSFSDPSQVYSTPVFTIIQAIEGMAQCKKLGKTEKDEEEEEKEEKKRNFILTIVSVALIFVPFVGEEAAAAAGMATLARSIAVAGEAANTGLAIYDTVQDPKSAIINVIGSALGVGSITKAVRSGEGLKATAKLRTEMKASEVSGLGALFKSNDDTLQRILKVCRWK